jgi:hypothetical protein
MARRHVYDPLETTTERRWYVVKNMHELPPGIDLKREFILAMLGCIDAGWSIGVRVPFLPEVAVVIIQCREFIDLRERPLPQFQGCLRIWTESNAFLWITLADLGVVGNRPRGRDNMGTDQFFSGRVPHGRWVDGVHPSTELHRDAVFLIIRANTRPVGSTWIAGREYCDSRWQFYLSNNPNRFLSIECLDSTWLLRFIGAVAVMFREWLLILVDNFSGPRIDHRLFVAVIISVNNPLFLHPYSTRFSQILSSEDIYARVLPRGEVRIFDLCSHVSMHFRTDFVSTCHSNVHPDGTAGWTRMVNGIARPIVGKGGLAIGTPCTDVHLVSLRVPAGKIGSVYEVIDAREGRP